jgi:hypothetical protein
MAARNCNERAYRRPVQQLRWFTNSLIAPENPGVLYAGISGANLAREPAPASSGRIVCWSGWVGEGPFDRDFRTWTKPAWEALERACGAFGGTGLCLLPHPRHILSDAQSCLTLLRRFEGGRVRLVLDPAGMLTGTMLDAAEDHLARTLDSLAHHPGVAVVRLTNVERDADDPDLLRPAPLDRGLLDPALIVRMFRSTGRSDVPVALLDDGFEAQASLLRSL